MEIPWRNGASPGRAELLPPLEHLGEELLQPGMLGIVEQLRRGCVLDDVAAVHEDAPGKRPPWRTPSRGSPRPSSCRPQRASRSTSSTSPTISGSSALVASSKSMIDGFIASARAIATRCFCPPDSVAGFTCAFSARPTWSSSSSAFFSAAALSIFFVSSGARVTLSITVMCGKRLKCWKTMPMCWRTLSRSTFGSVRSYSSTTTLPPVMSSSLFRQRRNVDLPEPDGPMTQTTSPWLMVVSMPLSTTRSPKDFFRPSIRILTVPSGLGGGGLGDELGHFTILFSSRSESLVSAMMTTK